MKMGPVLLLLLCVGLRNGEEADGCDACGLMGTRKVMGQFVVQGVDSAGFVLLE